MIESGAKPEEYREATPYWIIRLVDTHSLGRKMLSNVPDVAASLIGSGCIHIKDYTHVQFSLGYPKKGDESRRMTFELKGIVYREGREEWGAEKGKKYLVEELGRRTTLDGTRLWKAD